MLISRDKGVFLVNINTRLILLFLSQHGSRIWYCPLVASYTQIPGDVLEEVGPNWVPVLNSVWERSEVIFKAVLSQKWMRFIKWHHSVLFLNQVFLIFREETAWLLEIKGSQMDHSRLDTIPWRGRPVDVNSGRRRREVKVVSSEENGKSKTYKTYRDLDTIQKRKEKNRQRNLVKEPALQCLSILTSYLKDSVSSFSSFIQQWEDFILWFLSFFTLELWNPCIELSSPH